ncbi:outer membrane protein assembly factor BamB family protein [Halorarum salinum]|uniref:PQQ-binding-like beta-propeller repeat protein n=1 Tax=Halorarum salinum TaxID=2743089 RepID=A0A7D5L8G3_9EURY|nr:PQQ-binding-like beta-propeller repeat protein [Halobaculum salinum]QLG60613.1 PQQ-binding-like beta-propeller repeat protein [Halobaculum salinum]
MSAPFAPPSAGLPRSDGDADASRRPRHVGRRSLLAGIGTVGLPTLAGCSAVDEAVDGERRRFPEGDWPMVGRDARNSSSFPDARAPRSVEKRWEAPIGTWPFTGPVSADGLVLLPADGRLHAFSTRTGEEEWVADLPHDVGGTPAISGDGLVCVSTRERTGDGDGAFLHGYGLQDGRRLWSRRLGPGRPYAVRVDDGTAFVRTSTACVAADVADGEPLWRTDGFDPIEYDEYNLDGVYAIEAAPTVADGRVYVPARNALVALGREGGAERWRVDVPYCYASPSVGPDGTVYARGHAEGVAAVTPDGSVIWRVDDGGVGAPAVTDDAVFLAYADLVEVGRGEGAERWRYDLRADFVGATPVAFSDVVVGMGVRPGAVRRRSRPFGLLGRGRRWTLPDSAADVVSPCVADGRLFVVDSIRGRLLAYG